MAMHQTYQLPFEVERACRCSFVVRLENEQRAFISNENLLTIMMNPNTPMKFIKKMNRNGTEQTWIIVCKTEWTLGFKNLMLGPDGRKP